MRVTVTGGDGFLGRHVVDALRAQGDEVFVVRRDEFDLRDAYQARGAIYESHAEAVVHLAAAVGGIGDNVERPGEFVYDNGVMGLHLMEEARKAGVTKFLTVGTACMYPRDVRIPIKEEYLWDGPPAFETAAYAHAKRLILVQGQAYREQYDFNAVMVIPTNLYGPGDTSNHVVPSIIRKVSEAVQTGSDEVMLWGSGSATRDLLYVTDAAAGIVAALNYYDEAEPVNLGMQQEIPIYVLARAIRQLYGWDGTFTWDPTGPEGTNRRSLDTRRAHAKLGWGPQVHLKEGLERTIAWHEGRSVEDHPLHAHAG